MKVKITDGAKKWMTLAELPLAKKIVADMKDDDGDAAFYARIAADAILNSETFRNGTDWTEDILSASAEICRDDGTPWDQFGEGTGRLNVWIEAIVETGWGFLKLGVLLSDIWALDGSEDTRDDLIRHGYIRYYEEQK